MQFVQETEGGVAIVKPMLINLDAACAKEFLRLAKPIVESNARIAFDMSQIRFVDSSGLGVLLALQRTISPAASIRYFAVAAGVQSMFRIANVHRILDIFPTRQAALDAPWAQTGKS